MRFGLVLPLALTASLAANAASRLDLKIRRIPAAVEVENVEYGAPVGSCQAWVNQDYLLPRRFDLMPRKPKQLDLIEFRRESDGAIFNLLLYPVTSLEIVCDEPWRRGVMATWK